MGVALRTTGDYCFNKIDQAPLPRLVTAGKRTFFICVTSSNFMIIKNFQPKQLSQRSIPFLYGNLCHLFRGCRIFFCVQVHVKFHLSQSSGLTLNNKCVQNCSVIIIGTSLAKHMASSTIPVKRISWLTELNSMMNLARNLLEARACAGIFLHLCCT